MDVSLQEKHCRLSARASHQGQDGSPKPSLRLPRRPHQLVRITSYGCLVLVLFILCLTVLPTVSAAGSCSTNLYSCPNCGGINVTDCLQCDGFLNTDPNAKQCYTRALFTDTPTYNTLWRDIVGTFVWFLAAGVATACGVGGGGIYVPLGMLLLGFAPKPASGLSQASIFGASLGGLLLNIRDFHPNTEITMKSGHKEQQNDNDNGDNNVQQQPSNDEDASSSSNNNNQELKSYTRPLIDYNMALFLAPLEMAGAVLGVLIQKVLPNWLYLTLAAIILAFTAYKTYKKWWSTRATERKKAAAAAASAAQEDEQEQEIETPNEEANASLHTKHVRSNPNVRKVDWSAPSEMYLYPSSDNLEPPKDGGDENADKQWTGSVGGNNMSIDGNQQATIGEDGDEEQDNTESNVHSVGSTSSKAHDDSFHDSSHASGRNSNNEDEDPTKTESSATSSNGGRSLREQCIQWLEKDARQYPREKLLALLVLWIGLILLTFMKGGKGVDSIVGITCESPWYGVLIAIQFLWTLGFALVFGLKLVKEQKAKEACGYPFLEYDVLWDNAKLRFYAFFTFCAGIVAGLIGVGGGMVRLFVIEDLRD